MSEVIPWCTFVGAWLLVIGPIQQAAIDIDDEEFDREQFSTVIASAPRPPQVSRWWLLVPPVAYVLKARRDHAYQQAVLSTLSATQLEQILHFRETTGAWMFVAVGGFLLATSETWELHEHYEWPGWAFWALLVGMLVFCIGSTATRVHRRTRMLAAAGE